ncbi:MAG: ADP-forming succinate--CoA ligase subunit beta [Fidelibacterota bacterium]
MKIHEYQAKDILNRFHVPVPRGIPAFSMEAALNAAGLLGYPCVVKAQIHAGGRGKGGGVKIARSESEARQIIENMLGKPLITRQTGPEGKIVNRLFIEEAVDIERELYAGVVIDRNRARPVMMVSTEGGMEIEEVAAEMPEKIAKEYALPGFGLQAYQYQRLVSALRLEGEQRKKGVVFLQSLYNVFRRSDASLVEVNPLVVTRSGALMALDAKLNFDDNALFRHPQVLELRDFSEEDPAELEASENHLNYVRLGGNVGCMVNGAGLAMATMDIIKLHGGEPANFLDVGGVASPDTVANGFEILMSDENVNAVLINIFGGIVRCDRVARGIVTALQSLVVSVPVVIRLEGTNAEEARRILEDSALNFTVADSFDRAAKLVVKAANRGVK